MTDWIEQISENCKVERKKVADLLNKYNVSFSPNQPMPKNLLIDKQILFFIIILAGIFTVVGFYQMAIWALGKHRNYKKEFSNSPFSG